MGLLGMTKTIDEEDSSFYISVVGYLHNCKVGINIPSSEGYEEQLTPFNRAIEVMRIVLQAYLKREEL